MLVFLGAATPGRQNAFAATRVMFNFGTRPRQVVDDADPIILFGKFPTTSVRQSISRSTRSWGLLDRICRRCLSAKEANARSSGHTRVPVPPFGVRSAAPGALCDLDIPRPY